MIVSQLQNDWDWGKRQAALGRVESLGDSRLRWPIAAGSEIEQTAEEEQRD